MDRRRSWADLPVKILRLFLDRLFFADNARSAAVCTSWRSVAADRPHFRALNLPWLLVTNTSHADESTTWGLFSPVEGRLHRLDLPGDRGTRCVGASHGWLVMSENRSGNNYLLNPLTNQKVAIAPGQIFSGMYAKAILSSPPSAIDECLVVASNGAYDDQMRFCRPGDKSWSAFPNVKKARCVTDLLFRGVTDFLFRGGLLYCVNIWKEVFVFQFYPQPKLVEKCIPKRTRRYENSHLRSHPYLVESAGELLMVIRYMMDDDIGESDEDLENDSGKPFREVWTAPADFEVFTVNSGKFKCVPVKSLGDRSLVLGIGCSRSITAPDGSEFRRNCIYFTELDHDSIYDNFADWGEFCLEDENINMKDHPTCEYGGPFWLMLGA